MAKKKTAASPAPADPLSAIAAEFGVPLEAVQVAADLWGRHHRYQHVDADATLAYVSACGRMVNAAGEHVAPAVVERVKVHTLAAAQAERVALESAT